MLNIFSSELFEGKNNSNTKRSFFIASYSTITVLQVFPSRIQAGLLMLTSFKLHTCSVLDLLREGIA